MKLPPTLWMAATIGWQANSRHQGKSTAGERPRGHPTSASRRCPFACNVVILSAETDGGQAPIILLLPADEEVGSRSQPEARGKGDLRPSRLPSFLDSDDTKHLDDKRLCRQRFSELVDEGH